MAGTTVMTIFIHHSTLDRKSTRLNSSHVRISYAVFCLKKKKYHNSSSSFALHLHPSPPIMLLTLYPYFSFSISYPHYLYSLFLLLRHVSSTFSLHFTSM